MAGGHLGMRVECGSRMDATVVCRRGGSVTSGIFVGLSTVDVVYGVTEFPSANSKVVARSQDVFVGGPATNASVTFGHLGGKSTLVTTVGRHPLGSAVREELHQYSIQLIDLNPDFDGVPVISSVAVNATGERNVISANATRVSALPAQVDEGILDTASVILVDGHYMEACRVWAEAARTRGIHVVLDGGSWKAQTEELLKCVDSAICSADFLPPTCSTEDDVLKYLNECGVMNIAITKGSEPIRFMSNGSSGILEVPPIEVVDTMGAGDIFHGAFCYHTSLGRGFIDALTEAIKIASESCKFRGTREWMNQSAEKRLAPIVKASTGEPGGVVESVTVVKDSEEQRSSISVPEGSQTDLAAFEKKTITRRKFGWEFFATAALVGIGLGQTVEMTPDFVEKVEELYRRRKEAIKRQEEFHDLLNCYLYPSNPGSRLEARVPLVPAMQDPWGPPKRKFSGSGNAVAAAYYSTFRSFEDKENRVVRSAVDVHDDDAPVIIASHLVSEPAARYFGNPKSLHPNHEVRYHDSGGGFKASLRWAIYTPEHAKVVSKRELFEGSPMIRKEPVHSLSDLDNPKLRQPTFNRQGEIDYQVDDYLLITVLPRDSRFDRRMISLAGLHKPGTLAAEEFLNSPDLALRILKEIHEKIEGAPYYQALIALKVDHSLGSPRPSHLELRGAQVVREVARLRHRDLRSASGTR